MDSPKRNTGPNALRRGRCSVPNATYFVTICVESRQPVLIPDVASGLLAAAHRMTEEAIWFLRCMTVMPDHAHLLFSLGDRLSLPQCVARLKMKTQSALRSRSAVWQENFYDRQLRPDDPLETVIRYLHTNPFRAGLVATDKSWPWFYCCPEDGVWFEGLTDLGRPFPEWLG